MLRNSALIVSSLLLLAGLALPHAAPGWTMPGPIVENSEITISGPMKIAGSLGSTTCETDVKAIMEPGTKGYFGSFTVTPASCKTTGALAGCTVTSGQSTGMPYPMNTTGERIAVSGAKFDVTFHGAFCPYHEIFIESKGELTLTPDDPHAMTKLTWSGALEARNGTTYAFLMNVEASESPKVTPSDRFGIT